MNSTMADTSKPLLNPNEVPDFESEAFRKLGSRDQIRLIFEAVATSNYSMPVCAVFAMYGFFGALWFGVYYFVVMDPSAAMFSSLNMRKFILYNILHGVLGFGATCGPLGGKMKVPLGATGLTFLTPGTLCSPLFPGAVGLFLKTPGRRSSFAVVAFAAYVAALVWAIMDPCTERVILANAALGMACVFDTVIFFASRGEHYGYHMFCMMFPDWIAGCQWVQLMLWIMVGVSKVGPWFKYAIQVLAKDAIWTPLLPEHFSCKLWNKDWESGDFTPSAFTEAAAHAGAVFEWVFPLCCLATPGTYLNLTGVIGMMIYHAVIWATLPFASVFEWQYYTMVMTYYLYGCNSFSLPTSPLLVAFLVLVLVIIPVVGQIYPRLVPFLMAYRQYAGNWRQGSVFVRKSARAKLEKLRSYNPLVKDDAAAEIEEWKVGAVFIVVPMYRGHTSMLEKFHEDTGTVPDDFHGIGGFHFFNAAFGWDLGVGWLWYRDCVGSALVDICGFEAGECYFFHTEPASCIPPYKVHYRLFDVTKGPRDAEIYADVPYELLETKHPTEVFLPKDLMKRGNSINGTFLGTYY
eukprot:gb/GFBE01005014.1/.p1 GENE.gb/GFBE01005014.1/~~gb/GFBE01005014.1/.p1  ORF type:complete len:575 (+),score=122.97 gb/GFBE01005014.1/:1-1725(+)